MMNQEEKDSYFKLKNENEALKAELEKSAARVDKYSRRAERAFDKVDKVQEENESLKAKVATIVDQVNTMNFTIQKDNDFSQEFKYGAIWVIQNICFGGKEND